MFDTNSLLLEVSSTVNIFPESRLEQPTSVPLSIIDNTVADFARCAAVWYFDPPSNPEHALSASHLQASLSKTLNSYRPWCGRLSYTTPTPSGKHTERYQRIWVTYNTTTDIGIQFVTATTHRQLLDFIPRASQRIFTMKAWDALDIPSKQLFPETQLAISEDKDAPNVIIQFTTFACGSTAIAIEITHCLSDAVCLAQFAKYWSLISRSMFEGSPIPTISPIFDPQLLDSFAAGDIDNSIPDPDIQNRARALPQHRYDWYKQTSMPTDVPADLDPTWELSPSDPIPWEQWDTQAPCSQRVLHFSAAEIQHIYELATKDSKAKISKHDVLLAHVWTRINVARQLPEGTKAYLDMTFGLRARANPPLPDTFLGSPITHAAILLPSKFSSETPLLGQVATTIRETLAKFGTQEIADLLHDNAFEVAPQRLWRACLGREHVLLTTWVHSGVHDVDFGGAELRYVEAAMPACDGLVVVMEAPGKRERKHWSEGGVDVTVFLESGAMERLLVDGKLWG
ncbi:uncharacterized protein LY89DRAFT_98212 [Mollisia scopiformis]|uniref:Uncharacterized protein n=1 Tax=Mollisia scopiformis TaxID=149040 RepID=A0A194X728_MOLSC|nr:uncharacterized protein LY89DRAFT_98212 [Mollisia scopiformis]KUJ15894.1 hypothetical protein LY89DRAFT_98212 [Mollisia scopiformis]